MAAVCGDAGCVLETSCVVRRSARVMHKSVTNSEPGEMFRGKWVGPRPISSAE